MRKTLIFCLIFNFNAHCLTGRFIPPPFDFDQQKKQLSQVPQAYDITKNPVTKPVFKNPETQLVSPPPGNLKEKQKQPADKRGKQSKTKPLGLPFPEGLASADLRRKTAAQVADQTRFEVNIGLLKNLKNKQKQISAASKGLNEETVLIENKISVFKEELNSLNDKKMKLADKEYFLSTFLDEPENIDSVRKAEQEALQRDINSLKQEINNSEIKILAKKDEQRKLKKDLKSKRETLKKLKSEFDQVSKDISVQEGNINGKQVQVGSEFDTGDTARNIELIKAEMARLKATMDQKAAAKAENQLLLKIEQNSQIRPSLP